MTLAHYDQFLMLGWQQVRPNMLARNVEAAATSLRYPPIAFQPPLINWDIYYKLPTMEHIRKIIFTFNYVSQFHNTDF